MKKYHRYINESYITKQIEAVRRFTKTILYYVDELDGIVECYNMSSFFKPFSSEKELVHYAVNNESDFFLGSK